MWLNVGRLHGYVCIPTHKKEKRSVTMEMRWRTGRDANSRPAPPTMISWGAAGSLYNIVKFSVRGGKTNAKTMDGLN